MVSKVTETKRRSRLYLMIRLNRGKKVDLEVIWTKEDPAGLVQDKVEKYESEAD